MHVVELMTVVTVTIIDADYTMATAVSYVGEHETLEEVIQSVKDDAISNFNDEGGNIPYRAVINVNEVPVPTLSATVVKASVPEGEADAIVTAKVE